MAESLSLLLPIPCTQHVIDHFLHAGVEEFLADEIGAETGCADDPVASYLIMAWRAWSMAARERV